MAAHAIMDLDKVATSAIGMVLAILGHVEGWPMPKGGAQQFTSALVSHLKSLGGELITGQRVDTINDLPKTRTILFDITPEQLLKIAGSYFPVSYQKKLMKYRYGPGVFKLDWALDEPIPFTAKICEKAGTIHLGGTMNEIVESEKIVWRGRISEKPFVLLVQPSRFDHSRAPEGKHTAWAYCHVPNGSTFDMTTIIENQIERFAPGFKDTIIKRHKMNTSDFQAYNANYIGGDINGGVQDIKQLFTRPVRKWIPYATAKEGIYICSSSTPPGGGVHGMCGYHAAMAALTKLDL
jgi:phytoene dehydrogenase-like protein